MQAVILAAGRSTRTYPLTITRPKPLLRIANQTIIEHNLEQLDGLVDEAIVVIGYKGDDIKAFLGEKYNDISITYVEQEESAGTATALKTAKSKIKDSFILMFGDDLYSRKDIINLIKYKNSILAKKVDNPSSFGVLRVEDGNFLEIIEKPSSFISDLVSVGCFVFSKDFLAVLDKIHVSERGEYELTDGYNIFAKKEIIKVIEVEDYWLPITYPWSLLNANSFLLNRKVTNKRTRGAKIEKGARIRGRISVGKGTIIKSGVYIEGPVMIGKNCVIGPNCYLRAETCIGDNCHIGNSVEIKNSIIGDGSKVAHLSYVGDSVLGQGVNFGAGTITANLRHDGKNVRSMVKDVLVDTDMKKIGVFVGDYVKTGIHTSFYPGVKIDSDVFTFPGDIIKRDIKK